MIDNTFRVFFLILRNNSYETATTPRYEKNLDQPTSSFYKKK